MRITVVGVLIVIGSVVLVLAVVAYALQSGRDETSKANEQPNKPA